MSKTSLASAITLAALGTGLTLPGLAQADFLKDSKASVELRNFYFNRDFRQPGASQKKAEEWAQGFLLRYESGFTEGTIGVGVDAIGLLGVKLDSSPDRSGTGLLKRDRESKRAQDEYGELGVTAKLRASKSVLKVGTLMPKLPSVQYNDSRLLPQTFKGGHLNSLEIDGLTLDAGRLTQVNQRDSSDYEDMTITSGGARGITFRSGTTSDAFNFGGATYKWNDNLTTGYNYGNLDDLYKQHIFTLVHTLPLGDKQSLKSDIRYARSTDEGTSNVDNKAFGAMFTYALGGHAFGLGYQSMSGDTGYAYINGTDPYLVNYVQIGDFANKDEKSWQARYDFNFASVGIPGLTFMTRYLSGDNVDLGAGRPDGKEWERNTDIAYVFQDGPLKNLGVKWRNATVRSTNFGNDLDENRLIVSYVIPLW
ncbi:OprD family porin [Pseudomonas otitidis]|uniref:OprD family porin n=1 Tax=Metapseudomonas otitidis TaxID=319939 RepID=UPI0024499B71|nr:OprD family porin [Pseudomonas otitidis]MDH1107633.1 OprD family porin [Pseudomonas otitidis]MDH1160152.1 OprD family porin [Pseudomonas otitidis]MDH1166242.1 OprD family porin [Pseudomonas otitidis]WIF66003.1 OprD family porin [Pseudomonas otitidis]WMR30835.1 OprD family porin [Pseudomonas otitidis]